MIKMINYKSSIDLLLILLTGSQLLFSFGHFDSFNNITLNGILKYEKTIAVGYNNSWFSNASFLPKNIVGTSDKLCWKTGYRKSMW
jgi:hypothetical protein